MGYRKKAFRLEIRRGDFGDGYIVRYNGGERPDRATEYAIVNAIGVASLDAALRSVKALEAQKPQEPNPPA